MPTSPMVEYEAASPEVRAIYDAIIQSRPGRPDPITPYWKIIANHPPSLKRTWEDFQSTMAGGALDPVMKEMIYLAVSITNRCDYCVQAHTNAARALGMTAEMHGELMAVVALANGLNQYAVGYRIPAIES